MSVTLNIGKETSLVIEKLKKAKTIEYIDYDRCIFSFNIDGNEFQINRKIISEKVIVDPFCLSSDPNNFEFFLLSIKKFLIHLKKTSIMHSKISPKEMGEFVYKVYNLPKELRISLHFAKRQANSQISIPFFCPICYNSYRNLSTLERHLESHYFVYHCHLCGKSYNSFQGITSHIQAKICSLLSFASPTETDMRNSPT